MNDGLSAALAILGDRVAKPGDPDLDMHLTGLRIAELVVLPDADGMTEFTLVFETSEAAGFWIDLGTGECFYPDQVKNFEWTGAVAMAPGFGHMMDVMIRRLEAWRADGSLVAVTAAPGKWTLLHCPQHPAGMLVPLPRGNPDNTEGGQT